MKQKSSGVRRSSGVMRTSSSKARSLVTSSPTRYLPDSLSTVSTPPMRRPWWSTASDSEILRFVTSFVASLRSEKSTVPLAWSSATPSYRPMAGSSSSRIEKSPVVRSASSSTREGMGSLISVNAAT